MISGARTAEVFRDLASLEQLYYARHEASAVGAGID